VVHVVGADCDPDGRFCGDWMNTGLYCADQGDGSGRCAEIEIVQSGGVCDRQTRFCAGALSAFFCVPDGEGAATGTCQPQPAAGQPCAEPGICSMLEAVCNEEGQCQRATEGDACVDGDECALGFECSDDERCAAAPGLEFEIPAPCTER